MAESSGHAVHIIDVGNVASLEGLDEHAADALPHNKEASNVEREAPVLGSAAVNGANAIEASLTSKRAGMFTISLCVLCMATVAFTHAETSRASALLSSTCRQ